MGHPNWPSFLFDQQVPDFTTFWRFREALAKGGHLEDWFTKVIRQREAKGLL